MFTRGKLSRSSVMLHLGCQSWGNNIPTSQWGALSLQALWFTHFCASQQKCLKVNLEVSFLNEYPTFPRSCGNDSCKPAIKEYFKAILCFSAAILPEDTQRTFASSSLLTAVCSSGLCGRCTQDRRVPRRVLSSYIQIRLGTCVNFVSVQLTPT